MLANQLLGTGVIGALVAPATLGALARGTHQLATFASSPGESPKVVKKPPSAPSLAENTNRFVMEALQLLDYPERLQRLLLRPQVPPRPC